MSGGDGMNGQPVTSPFHQAAQQVEKEDASHLQTDASGEEVEQTAALRTTSGGDTTSSAVSPQPRQSGEIAAFGRGANASGGSGSGSTPQTQLSDAMRRFSSAGSQVVTQLQVVSRFQELVRMAGEAFVDPAALSRVRDLGEGSFAKVVQCRLERDGRQLDVAVKLLKPALFNSDLDVADFVREGIVLRRMRHASVVSVVGLGFKSADGGRGASPDSLFIVQELCRGGTLRDVVATQMFRPGQASFDLTQDRLYTYADSLRWATQIAAGMAHIHKAHPLIIHRDLKLDNVLLTGSSLAWDAKIADFGLHATVDATERSDSVKQLKRMATQPTDGEKRRLADDSVERTLHSEMRHSPATRKLGKRAPSFPAKQLRSKPSPFPSAKSSATDNTSHSSVGSLLQRMFTMRKKVKPRHDLTAATGSYLNMAPEVVLGEPYNEQADIFSLGICLYELFTRTLTAATVITLGSPFECQDYAYKVARGYRRPCPLSWPPELSLLVQQCWAQDPDTRPSAQQVLERLQSLAESGDIQKMDAVEETALRKRNRKFCCF